MSVRERAGRWVDLVVALALTGSMEYHLWAIPPVGLSVTGGRGVAAVVLALVAVPLAWRRRAPLVVLFTVVGAVVAGSLLISHAGGAPLEAFLAVILAFYSVGANGPERRAPLGAGAALAAFAVFDLAHGGIGNAHGSRPAAWLVFAVAWLVGRDFRRRRREVVLLRDRATRLEHEREEKARAAVTAERARIARELHDVVAHSVSVMVVQAQAAQRVLAGEQQAARDLLGSIEGSGRQALAELRRLLGLLRRFEEQPTLAPQPSLRHLDDLVEQLREAGLPVEVTVEGDPAPLSPGVDLSAYRIVQEALTNTLKHAGPARAHVLVRYTPGELQLEVADDGAGTGNGGGAGQGLVGMCERVALYGGELESGRRAGGGYFLRARLPLGAER